MGLLECPALGKASPETHPRWTALRRCSPIKGFAIEPVRLSGLDRALDRVVFFFGPVVAQLFAPRSTVVARSHAT